MKHTLTKDSHANREWKSSAFTAYFGTKERAAELYQVLHPEEGEISPEDIDFCTLEDVLFMARKNDMAFTINKKVLVIGEHQSTVNLNMPLRGAIYYGRTLEKYTSTDDLYRRKRIMIPTPEFYTFYNGSDPQPLEETLKISDAYLEKTDEPMLELKTKVININLPEGHEILKRSRSLYEYSWFVQRIRDRIKVGGNLETAISEAIKDCLTEGIMVDFIRQYGSEVNNMLFHQFDLDEAMKVWREEDYQDGLNTGFAEGHEVGLAKGLEAGLAEGREAGLAEGEHLEKLAIAKRMLERGDITDEIILFSTGITENELLTIKSTL